VGDRVETCQVNGETVRLADYLRSRGLAHGRLPLVGDFAGAHINVSLQQVGEDSVSLYAPVFPGWTTTSPSRWTTMRPPSARPWPGASSTGGDVLQLHPELPVR
jgi:hypothetical protein